MIQQIYDLPANVVGFKASGEVTKDDYENTIIPAVSKLVQTTGEINYLFMIDTPLKNFTAGAWIEDMFLGLKNMSKWHRVAIIAESEGIKTFTDIFGKLAPGEYKAYTHADYGKAVDWLSSEWMKPSETGDKDQTHVL